MVSGWADIQAALNRYAVLIAWVGGSAAVLPFAMSQVGFAPPEPRSSLLLAAIVQVVSALLALQITDSRSVQRSSRKLKIASVFLIIVIVVYGWAHSQLVFLGGPAKAPLIKGLACTDGAKRLYGDLCPLLSNEIIDKGEIVSFFWTAGSISAAKSLLLIGWLMMFASLSFALVSFISFQSMRRSRFIDIGPKDKLQPPNLDKG